MGYGHLRSKASSSEIIVGARIAILEMTSEENVLNP